MEIEDTFDKTNIFVCFISQARRKNTGFTVAMKFINKHGKSEKDIKNLRQEIGILRKLNHENIILMFDAFETDRDFCVVTEYGQGELFDILQDDKRLPEKTVQQIAKQLIKALHYLHSNRIIHRYVMSLFLFSRVETEHVYNCCIYTGI